jgi:hypothetical protein
VAKAAVPSSSICRTQYSLRAVGPSVQGYQRTGQLCSRPVAVMLPNRPFERPQRKTHLEAQLDQLLTLKSVRLVCQISFAGLGLLTSLASVEIQPVIWTCRRGKVGTKTRWSLTQVLFHRWLPAEANPSQVGSVQLGHGGPDHCSLRRR